MAAGIGPLDAGVGIFFYDPHPPAYVDHGDEGCDDCDEPGHTHPTPEAGPDDADTAGDEGGSVQTFVYQAF